MISILLLLPEGVNFHPLPNAERVDLPLAWAINYFAFKKISSINVEGIKVKRFLYSVSAHQAS
jgi:hypothetical protein